jgi:hypothetical protein
MAGKLVRNDVIILALDSKILSGMGGVAIKEKHLIRSLKPCAGMGYKMV